MLHIRIGKLFCLALALCCAAAPLSLAEEGVLDGETNLALETRLSELGYFTEVPDETGGESTRTALANCQTANGLEPTGVLDGETARTLRGETCLSKQAFLTGLAARYAGVELAQGASGSEVAALQQSLADLGYYPGRADSVFGEATGEAVALFQQAMGLASTGEADGATLYRLMEGELPTREEYLARKCAIKGDSGSRVKLAQQRLKALGYFAGDCTGSYGDATAQAVERFQAASALAMNGQLDMATCAALYAPGAAAAPEEAQPSGDAQEPVRLLQRQLADLGYYAGEINGEEDAATRTALDLYAIANGLAAAPASVDPEHGVRFADAEAAFRSSRRQASPEVLQNAARSAEALVGTAFADGGSARFPGFAFVQYVFARSGVAFAEPGDIVGETGESIGRDAEPAAGGIVVLERESNGGTQLALAVSLGGGRLALWDAESGEIAASELSALEFQNAYLWVPDHADE